jgi:hypothetical protein
VWDARYPPRAFPFTAGVTDVPLMAEYTWYITPAEADVHLRLAREDLDRAAARDGAAFVALSHFYAMTGEHRASLELYDAGPVLSPPGGVTLASRRFADRDDPSCLGHLCCR